MNRTEDHLREHLVRRCRQLEQPRDYWRGRQVGPTLRPQNILVFSRGFGKTLQPGDAFRTQHHRHVLIGAVQGEGSVGVDDRVHPLRAGQSLLIQPFQIHWYEGLRMTPEWQWIFVTFEHDPDERLEVLRDLGGLEGDDNPAVVLRFLDAWQKAALQDLLPLRLAEWLFSLGIAAREKRGSGFWPPPVPSDGELVAKINRILFQHRETRLSLARVAKHLGMSSSLLRMRFHEVAGSSVGKYIRERKLQYSCELLQSSRHSVSEIALRCGYGSVFSFSRAFQRVYRLAPGKYRKMATRTTSPATEPPGRRSRKSRHRRMNPKSETS